MSDFPQTQSPPQPFLSDVKTLRARAQACLEEGAVTPSYGGDAETTIEILQAVLSTELVCMLRYTQHAIAATGLSSESVKSEFAEHAREEQEHAMRVAERINQLGGAPDLDPQSLTARSVSEYKTAEDLVAMIRENLIAERIAVEHYRELIRYFAGHDPVTRRLLEDVLAKEEEHASDMLDLLTRHGGVREAD